jgi:hypothetical protein
MNDEKATTAADAPSGMDWSDFEPKDERDAVGVALIECGLFKDEQPNGDVSIDWWLTDALIEALRHRGWVVRLTDPEQQRAIGARFDPKRPGLVVDEVGDVIGWTEGGKARAVGELVDAARAVLEPDHDGDATCWCQPTMTYEDPATGVQVWTHKESNT